MTKYSKDLQSINFMNQNHFRVTAMLVFDTILESIQWNIFEGVAEKFVVL